MGREAKTDDFRGLFRVIVVEKFTVPNIPTPEVVPESVEIINNEEEVETSDNGEEVFLDTSIFEESDAEYLPNQPVTLPTEELHRSKRQPKPKQIFNLSAMMVLPDEPCSYLEAMGSGHNWVSRHLQT